MRAPAAGRCKLVELHHRNARQRSSHASRSRLAALSSRLHTESAPHARAVYERRVPRDARTYDSKLLIGYNTLSKQQTPVSNTISLELATTNRTEHTKQQTYSVGTANEHTTVTGRSEDIMMWIMEDMHEDMLPPYRSGSRTGRCTCSVPSRIRTAGPST